MSSYALCRLEIARLRPTERVDAAHAGRIAEEMRREGMLRRPLLVERHTLAILDGHHRFHAAQALGLRFISAVLIAYDDPRLTLASWTERSFTREEVLMAGRSGVLLPAKSTRHILTPPLPESPVPLAELALADLTPSASGR
ncbi:ParB N-terminal domain-containing protein [Aestuariivirga sp.]|uniref:ParB N-terminal domain-containing protein n=1 Tax=Aestuariivirga sp. TaxID=2650926 RepID=UPI00391DF508